MATRVRRTPKDELRERVAELVEEKLVELLGDPEESIPLRKAMHERLVRQKRIVARGERGKPFDEVVRRLGLE